ncbi:MULTISPECIES: hypothetical protein [unclassified Microcystis]|jgi:hypothetical protein|uniref:hypothetical protein n=1 Tax=Microcystis sp. TaxID=1127 RepID=UPI0022C5C6AC|nr:hypothetical protein [Microcystis sp. LE17-20D]MCZ8066705.1 hypothetical protein [Microcystis sp. LE17-20D]MCZ8273135.1 hypothetical protein [Microcystis sp. LE19-4.1E]
MNMMLRLEKKEVRYISLTHPTRAAIAKGDILSYRLPNQGQAAFKTVNLHYPKDQKPDQPHY